MQRYAIILKAVSFGMIQLECEEMYMFDRRYKEICVGLIAISMAIVSGCSDGESGTQVSTVTGCVEGSSECTPDGMEKICKGGKYETKSCSLGCKNGHCVVDPNAEEPIAEPGSHCDASYKPQCYNGTTRLYCDVNTIKTEECQNKQICIEGQCRRDPTTSIEVGDTCNPSTFIRYCSNESMSIQCLDNTVQNVPCKSYESCDSVSGLCLSEVVPSLGDSCSISSFKTYCKNPDTLYVCSDSKVIEAECPLGCRNGACRTNTCSDPNELSCLNDQTAVVCNENVYENVDCEPGTHCSSGVCVENPLEGSDCIRANFVGACISSNQYQVCVNDSNGKGKVMVASCSSVNGGELCLSGKCVQCDPNNFSVTCKDSKTRRICSSGEILDLSCNVDSPYCVEGNCVQCLNDGSYKQTCIDDKHLSACDENGKIVTYECPGSLTCNGGKCIGECDGSHPCGEHYKCEGNACVLDKVCNLTDSPICDNITNSVQRCVGLGWLETEKCANTDTCSQGKCIGNECDPATYGTTCSEDGKTPQYCLNGRITKMAPCASGICTGAGVCRDCDPETYVSTRCHSDTEEYFCNNYQTNWYRKCKNNETCIEGSGCVSKCGSDYEDQCVSPKVLEYCTESGEKTRVVCSSINDMSECIEGKCLSDVGKACDPAEFENRCFNNSMMQACDMYEGRYQIVKRTCSTESTCGTINGVVDCYKNCDPKNDTKNNCLYNDTEAWSAVCTEGTTFDDKPFNGYFRVNAFCVEQSSDSCRLNSDHALVRDHIFCASSGGTTCNPETGMCEGLASCTEIGGSCSGGTTAINCRPVGKTAVQTVTNCEQYESSCVEYEEDGVTVAACLAVKTTEALPDHPISSLGTCIGNKLYKLYFTGSSGAVMFTSMNCKTECVTASSNGQTYAYCK